MSDVKRELKTVNEIRINGKWVREEEVDPALFHKLLRERVDFAMKNAGFVRVDKKGAGNECKGI